MELKKELEQRLGAYEVEKTPEAATEIGRNYLLHAQRDDGPQVLRQGREDEPGSHVPALRGKLFIYEKFGMGWKVQETYKKLLALDPGSAASCRRKPLGPASMYGDFKTFDETPKIITNPKFKDVDP